MKILVVGGHLAPALAIIEELQKRGEDLEIVFVGRKYALDSEKTPSLEYKEIKKKGIKFISLQAGRLTRIFSVRSIRNFLRIPLGFINSFFIIDSQKPDRLVSFGGYLAVPLAFWAWFFRIPVYTHEQTINPGLANKTIGFFAKKIFVAFAEAETFFPRKKMIFCGNPLRNSTFRIIKKPFIVSKNKKVIYITGGSLGSHSINEHVKKIITSLLRDFIVIHQTGETKEYHDFEDLQVLRGTLPEELANRYFLHRHFFEDEIGYIYSVADLVIGRSGANTFFEILHLEKMALFIPLPWSAGREQQRHAEIFAKAGCGEIFHQIESSEKLLRLIKSMLSHEQIYRKNFRNLSSFYKQNASQIMVREILG